MSVRVIPLDIVGSVAKESFAAELRAKRRHLGLSQAEVARRCGLSQANISAYEADKRAISREQADRIRAVLRPRPGDVIRTHRAAARRLIAKHGGSFAQVFGSVARGEDRYDSDIDLLVTFRPGSSLFDVSRLTRDLEELFGVTVDVVSSGGLTASDGDILAEAIAL